MSSFKELDVVALLKERLELGVQRGWVGTLLLELAPCVWEVEFVDPDGRTAATAALDEADLLLLHMDLAPAR